MTLSDYLEYAIKNKLLNKLDFYYSLFTIKKSGDYSDKYIEIKNRKLFFKIGEELHPYPDYMVNYPPISIFTTLKVTPNHLKCVTKSNNAIIGVLILNYVLVEYPFDGKIEWVGDFDIGKFDNKVTGLLTDEKVTTEQYKTYLNNCLFLEELSRITTVSSTPKSMLPPPGIIEFKEKLYKEYTKKYGRDWVNNPVITVEFDKKLKERLSAWLEDDPANNILIDGKIKNNAMVKKYLSFSMASSFGNNDYIKESLLEGYPKEPEKLKAVFNTARHASYSRGNETQKGGASTKDILRSTSTVKITDKDCGVTYGKEIYIDESLVDSLKGRYYIKSDKSILIDSDEMASSFLNKTIELRSPSYCKHKNICAICASKKLQGYPNGVPLLITDMTSVLITSALKIMHNSIVKTTPIDMDDIIK